MISIHLLEAFNTSKYFVSDLYVAEICKLLVKNYFFIFWETISPAFLENGYSCWNAVNMLGAHHGNSYTSNPLGILFDTPHTNEIIVWCKNNTPTGPLNIARMMPIWQLENGTDNQWHSFAMEMINDFGNIDGILEEISANMGTFGFTGPVFPYYESQKILIEMLINHKHKKVREWSKKMVDNLIKVIQ